MAARWPRRARRIIYDWNLLPIGQLLWLKELETYRTFPSLQTPASYNLDNIIQRDAGCETHQPPGPLAKPFGAFVV